VSSPNTRPLSPEKNEKKHLQGCSAIFPIGILGFDVLEVQGFDVLEVQKNNKFAQESFCKRIFFDCLSLFPDKISRFFFFLPV